MIFKENVSEYMKSKHDKMCRAFEKRELEVTDNLARSSFSGRDY
jgi:hypothetical protein